MTDRKQTCRTPETRLGRTGDRPYWIWMVSIFIQAAHQVGAAVFLAVFLLPGRPDLPPGLPVPCRCHGCDANDHVDAAPPAAVAGVSRNQSIPVSAFRNRDDERTHIDPACSGSARNTQYLSL